MDVKRFVIGTLVAASRCTWSVISSSNSRLARSTLRTWVRRRASCGTPISSGLLRLRLFRAAGDAVWRSALAGREESALEDSDGRRIHSERGTLDAGNRPRASSFELA